MSVRPCLAPLLLRPSADSYKRFRLTSLAVQIWTRNNYHWYLKQEIKPLSDARSAFLAVAWHPEKAMELAILTAGALEMRSFSWDTFGPSLGAPRDTGVVAVTDGGK
jgi:elongator complex protein 1